MKIYTSKRLPDNVTEREKFIYYMHKLQGKDDWIAVHNKYDDIYYFHFVEVRTNDVDCQFLRIFNEYQDEFACWDAYSPDISKLCEAMTICEPIQIYSLQELITIYNDIIDWSSYENLRE